MSEVSSEYPKPWFVALLIFGGTVCIAVVFILLDVLLNMDSFAGGTASSFLAAMGVGQYLASKRPAPMPRRNRWLAASVYTLLTLALGAALLALDAALHYQVLGLARMSVNVLLIVAVVAAAVSVPLTYAGLLIGEKAAMKHAAKLAAKKG